MIALTLSILAAGLGVDPMPLPGFDHRAFCEQMQAGAAQAEVQPGSAIDATTAHGGISVNCGERTVDIQTLLSRPARKRWLREQERNWSDDICSDPIMADAMANGWQIVATILVRGKIVATFAPGCSRSR